MSIFNQSDNQSNGLKIEFKNYGHYRTGTNLIKILVEKHLDRLVHSDVLGNKHEGYNKFQFDLHNLHEAPHIKLLISIKHPYSWVVSFSKWTMRDGVYTDEVVDKLTDISTATIKRWCDSYNYLYKHWIELPYEYHVVKYEDLVVDCRKALDGIRKHWVLKYKSSPRHIDFVVRPGQEISYRTFDPYYYIEHRYIKEILPQQIKAIEETIDWDFFGKFGYTKDVPVESYVSDYQI